MKTILLLLCLVFAGCATKGTTVVLIENPDGSVGQVDVSTPAGEQRLSAARQSTTVTSPSAPPAPVRIMDQTEIERDYGQALQALPVPPEVFLLYFDSGTSNLTAESTPLLEKIRAAIVRRSSLDVRVNGHSDTVGSREDNARLSMHRAEAVRDVLARAGIASSNIQVFSHGEGNLLVPTGDEVPEPRNRRTEVLVR